MSHPNSLRAFNESARSISLAKQPTAQQMHDVCWKCAQMAADYFDGPVTLMLPFRLPVVREPQRKRYGT